MAKIYISPETIGDLSVEHKKAVAHFIADQVQSGIHDWKKNKTYLDQNGNKIVFSHDVIERKRKASLDSQAKEREGLRCELITGDVIGTGGGGSVSMSRGTLAINGDNLVFKDKVRAVKIGNASVNISAVTANPNLGKKEPTKMQSGQYAVSMKLIKGIDLSQTQGSFSHYSTDQNERTVGKLNLNFSLDEKKELTARLLDALKTQVIDLKKVHRDLKPDNIRLSVSDNKFNLTIIDFDNALPEKSISLDTPPDSGHFTPREIGKNKPVSSAQDLFSMGKIIWELWGDELRDKKSLSEKDRKGVEGIELLINKLISINPKERGTIKEAQLAVTEIKFDKPEMSPKEMQRQFFNAVLSGDEQRVRELKKNIDLMARNDEGRTALHIAVIKGDVALVRELLEKGAKPNIQDNQERTALSFVRFNKQAWAPILTMLLDKGAFTNVSVRGGLSSLGAAIKSKAPYSVISLLLDHGADPNIHSPNNLDNNILEKLLFDEEEHLEQLEDIPWKIKVANLLLEKGGKINYKAGNLQQIKKLEVYLRNGEFHSFAKKDKDLLPSIINSAVMSLFKPLATSGLHNSTISYKYHNKINKLLHSYRILEKDANPEIYLKLSKLIQKLEKYQPQVNAIAEKDPVIKTHFDDLLANAKSLASVTRSLGITARESFDYDYSHSPRSNN